MANATVDSGGVTYLVADDVLGQAVPLINGQTTYTQPVAHGAPQPYAVSGAVSTAGIPMELIVIGAVVIGALILTER